MTVSSQLCDKSLQEFFLLRQKDWGYVVLAVPKELGVECVLGYHRGQEVRNRKSKPLRLYFQTLRQLLSIIIISIAHCPLLSSTWLLLDSMMIQFRILERNQEFWLGDGLGDKSQSDSVIWKSNAVIASSASKVLNNPGKPRVSKHLC